jgi:hypothetical protein
LEHATIDKKVSTGSTKITAVRCCGTLTETAPTTTPRLTTAVTTHQHRTFFMNTPMSHRLNHPDDMVVPLYVQVRGESFAVIQRRVRQRQRQQSSNVLETVTIMFRCSNDAFTQTVQFRFIFKISQRSDA